MKIYRISYVDVSVEQWIANYVRDHGGENDCVFGGCNDLVDNLYWDIGNNDTTWERWGLYSFYDKSNSEKLPLVIKGKLPKGVIEDGESLCDIGWEHHEVAKLQGRYWDGKGGHNSLEEISEYFDLVENKHWIRTE